MIIIIIIIIMIVIIDKLPPPTSLRQAQGGASRRIQGSRLFASRESRQPPLVQRCLSTTQVFFKSCDT